MNRRIIGAVVALSALASAVSAAPYCVVASFGTECYYYDADSCRRAADNARGACVINQAEAQKREAPSGAPFCVYASYGTECYYYDAPSCQRAAAQARAVCIVNPNG